MSPIRYSALVLGTLTAFEVMAFAPKARASKAECANAYAQAQVLRKKGQLREAEKATIDCAQSSCPDFIKSACTKWGSEIETLVPTIVVSAKDGQGNDLTDVSVSSDGQKLADKLTGLPIQLNPGQHSLHFEHAGDKPVDQTILISEGEKARVVKVTFGSSPTSAGGGAGKPGPEASTNGSGTRTLSYVLGGVGVVGLAGFAYFALKGKSEEDAVTATGCKPDCSSSQVDPIKTKYLIADISLGVGVVSLGLATYFFITSMHKSATKTDSAKLHFDVVGSSKGSFATLSGSF
jgi:hypothetical protein